MQTNIARAADYDQPQAAGAARTTILIVADDATARLTIAAMSSLALCTDQRPRTGGRWFTPPPGRAGNIGNLMPEGS
jgi:hypothetical protein